MHHYLNFFKQDVDECQSNPCQSGGTCDDNINRYTCRCAAGYCGNNCETSKFFISPPTNLKYVNSSNFNYQLILYCPADINECSSNPCQNSGTCNDQINSYTCTCVFDRTGTYCETGIQIISMIYSIPQSKNSNYHNKNFLKRKHIR